MQRSFWGNPSGGQKRFEIFISAILVLILASCSRVTEPNQQATNLTQVPSLTATLTPIPSITPTPTYLSITPVLQETPLPEYGMPISKENLDRLTLLSQWGKGNPGSVVFSPDGKYFVVGTATGLYFYDPNDFSLLHYIDTQAAVRYIAISPDSQTLAAAVTAKVMMYQISNSQLLRSINMDANSLDFSPDGEILALGIDSDVEDYLQLRDAKTGKTIANYRNGGAEAWEVKFSPQGDLIASSGVASTLWALDGSILNQSRAYISGGRISSVSFSPDGQFLAEGSDYKVRIWRILGQGNVRIYRDIDFNEPEYSTVYQVAFSSDGTMVAVTTSDGIGAWDIATGNRIFFAATDNIVFYSSLAWSMDSSAIAAASSETGVMVWDVGTGDISASLNHPSGRFSSLAWSPDGQSLAVGAEESFAYIFSGQDGNVLQRFGSGYYLNTLAFTPDSQALAIGYGDLDIQIWDMDGILLHTLDGLGFGSSGITFFSNGSILAANLSESYQSTDQILFLNTDDWSNEKAISITDSKEYRIIDFVSAPDEATGAILYVDESVYYNKKVLIKIVSFSDEKVIATFEPGQNDFSYIDAMAYSPDGNMFAVFRASKPQRILVWDTSDWSLLHNRSIISKPRIGACWDQLNALSWSSDSKLIAVGLEDSSIQILNAMDGETLSTLDGHNMCVSGVSFSPDGRILASVSVDGTVKLWGLR